MLVAALFPISVTGKLAGGVIRKILPQKLYTSLNKVFVAVAISFFEKVEFDIRVVFCKFCKQG